MYKVLVFIVAIMLMLPTSTFAGTIYFHHDAETSPISCNYCRSDERWSEQSTSDYVTRVQNIVHSGKWALRHEIPNASVDNQTGKVIKFITATSFGGQVEAFYSSWFYIEEGFDDNTWKNIFQFKIDNGSLLPPPNNIGGGSAAKWTMGLNHIDGTRAPIIGITGCGLNEGDHPQQKSGKPCVFIASPRIHIPDNKWVHIEVWMRAADPARLGNQLVQQAGAFKVWQDGTLIFEVNHPNVNTLTNPNGGQWSTNRFLYWGIGAYASPASQQPRLVLYTDDAMVTDYPVHLTGILDTVPPLPPKGLTIVP